TWGKTGPEEEFSGVQQAERFPTKGQIAAWFRRVEGRENEAVEKSRRNRIRSQWEALRKPLGEMDHRSPEPGVSAGQKRRGWGIKAG
ncbi:MAG: hypothetical protein AAGN35_01425, partial [Bacteroidota bacterium]